MQDTMDIKRHVGIVELFRNVFRLYRTHCGIFWRIMIPIIIISILVDSLILLYSYRSFPEISWLVGTKNGVTIKWLFETEGNWNWTITYSSVILLFLWFTMFPLILCTAQLYRGKDVNFKSVWHDTISRIKTIIGANLYLLGVIVIIVVCFLSLSLSGFTVPLFQPMVGILAFISIMTYFFVKMSLFLHGIMIDNLSAIKAFRRSSQLVSGRWVGFFVRYLILIWFSGVVISILFSLTYIILSTVEPQFVQLRNVLLSGRIMTLLTGIDVSFTYLNRQFEFGNITSNLLGQPKYWIVGVLFVIKTVIYGIFTPVWAILTTHLYFEQAGNDN